MPGFLDHPFLAPLVLPGPQRPDHGFVVCRNHFQDAQPFRQRPAPGLISALKSELSVASTSQSVIAAEYSWARFFAKPFIGSSPR